MSTSMKNHKWTLSLVAAFFAVLWFGGGQHLLKGFFENPFGVFLLLVYLGAVTFATIALMKSRRWILAIVAGLIGLVLGGTNFLLNTKEDHLGTRSAVAFLVALLVFCTFLFFQSNQSRKRRNISLH